MEPFGVPTPAEIEEMLANGEIEVLTEEEAQGIRIMPPSPAERLEYVTSFDSGAGIASGHYQGANGRVSINCREKKTRRRLVVVCFQASRGIQQSQFLRGLAFFMSMEEAVV